MNVSGIYIYPKGLQVHTNLNLFMDLKSMASHYCHLSNLPLYNNHLIYFPALLASYNLRQAAFIFFYITRQWISTGQYQLYHIQLQFFMVKYFHAFRELHKIHGSFIMIISLSSQLHGFIYFHNHEIATMNRKNWPRSQKFPIMEIWICMAIP